ncbi:Serine chemoreceptor protein [Tritonibacter multivorans]|uniref:Serine chemoreceptor protein n=1 Tax=Tritonibacter multivorans TaxID=928856 RepID=A0A0P1GLL4_9RHOB|nr:methyl-accepting chemotaxis protein [Tritonibacter multivorans]MDA7420771.1 methyl-accepting chemotaxis protein [Tritonibacter multivorans]CUH75082.1 Serine chemoreceptor protein [Tritonibacter multivorans]SFC87262.1 methyl-accepting chemotaxis sensory transducer [Tritonibacter multivorans]
MPATNWFANRPVKQKILIPGLAGLLLMMVTISAFWAQKLSDALYSGFESKVEVTNSFVSVPLATAAWNYDGELAVTTLAKLAEQKPFIFAKVVSAGDTLAETSRDGEISEEWNTIAAEMLETGAMKKDMGDRIFYRTPLEFEGESAGDLIWALDTSIVADEINSAHIMAAILGVGFFAAFTLTLFMISGAVARPMNAVVKHIDALQKGNTELEIPEANRKDEIGALGQALVAFRDATAETQRMEDEKRAAEVVQKQVVADFSDALGKLSGGDLTARIEAEFPAEYEKLRSDFNTLIDRLFETLSAVIEASDSIQNGSTEISSASDDLARRTESQAATLEETAAALDELTSSVRQAADGASSVAQTMDDAKAQAVNSGEIVNNAVSAMTEIEQSSTHISQIIGVIDDIAFQTNLLALNAGVEAARAGEAGRGFAVVASEVRALAQRSSDAAMEIKTLIGDSSKQVERGVDLVGRTGEALHQIVEEVTQISGLISEIAQGAKEQSTGLGDINNGMVELDQVTQQNAAMVEEATAASHMLKANAQNLVKMVTYFNLGDGRSTATAFPDPASASAPAEVTPSAHGDGWEQADDWAEPEATPAPMVANGDSGKIWQDF